MKTCSYNAYFSPATLDIRSVGDRLHQYRSVQEQTAEHCYGMWITAD